MCHQIKIVEYKDKVNGLLEMRLILRLPFGGKNGCIYGLLRGYIILWKRVTPYRLTVQSV
jgi:hypothetical protein